MSGTFEVASITPVAPAVVEVDLRAVEPPAIDVVPGQYLSVLLADGERRAYSIASPPGRRDGVTLLIRQRGLGARFVAGLVPGQRLAYDGPRGEFRLAPAHPGDLVFVATGVGASALVPMIEEALARPEAGRVWFFWGLEAPEDRFWQDRLDAMARSPRFAPRVVFAATDGFVTGHVLAAVPSLVRPTFYLCGHGQMVRDLGDSLEAAGVERAAIRTDVY